MKEIEIQPFKLILKFVNKGVKKHEFSFYQVQNIEHSLCLLMKPFTKAITLFSFLLLLTICYKKTFPITDLFIYACLTV